MEGAPSLTLDNLECHFNWRPEHESTKEGCLDDVISKIKNKISRYPHFAIAYRCTLAYLYPKINDFNSAFDVLEDIEYLQMPQDCEPPERWLDCDFIVKANHLKLRELELFENRKVLPDVTQELTELSELWESNKVQASVYAIKGITYNCFGPMKYPVAVEAFKRAIELAEEDPGICTDWQMFDWLWGCAFSMSRVTRQTAGLLPSDEELCFWNKALFWKEDKNLKISDSLFFAHFAESIMLLNDRRSDCENMIQKSFLMWSDSTPERKKMDRDVLTIKFKFRLKNPGSNTIDQIVTEIEGHLGDDIELYRQIAKCLNYKDENTIAIEILENGLRNCGNDENIWVDLQLLNRYSNFKPEDWILRKYSSLLQKYKVYGKNIALLYSHRSKMWLSKYIHPNRFKENFMPTYGAYLDECVSDLVQSLSIDPELSMKQSYLGKLRRVVNFSKTYRPEYLSWFMQTFTTDWNETEIIEIIRLYRNVLEDETASIERTNFARKHLGLFYIRIGKATDAVATLRDLSKEEDCKVCFVEAVLSQTLPKLEELIECLQLGNCDVIELILNRLEVKKQQTIIGGIIMQQDFFDKNPQTFFFSRHSYEVCARIQLLMEDENSFFVNKEKALSPEFKDQVIQRVRSYLEIPTESSNVVTYVWRRHRLDLTKTHLRLSEQSNNDVIQEKLINILHVLRESRSALDACISSYFGLHSNSHYPHAFQRMTKEEKTLLRERTRSQTNFDRDRPGYLEKRMKDRWLRNLGSIPATNDDNSGQAASSSSSTGPNSGVGENTLKYIAIEGLVREGFRERGKLPDEILKFLAWREYHIITKEAGWHAIWVQMDNFFKHNDHSRNIGELENKLNEYRNIQNLSEQLTAYDLAHKTAEFAEQTLVVFTKPSTE